VHHTILHTNECQGPDIAHYRVTNNGDPTNKIEDYVHARYLSAPEAAWHILNFETVRKEPSVVCLPVHFAGENQALRNTESHGETASLLDRYFLRPAALHRLQYEEYYENYILYPY